MPTEQELFEIGERMGEAAHVAWMEKRRKERGWHAPEDCPCFERDCGACGGTKVNREGHPCIGCNGTGHAHCVNCHPCMRPYKDLPDSEKELNRPYPQVFMKILADMGYVVDKKPSDFAIDPYKAWNDLKRWLRSKKGVPVSQDEFMTKMVTIEQGKTEE